MILHNCFCEVKKFKRLMQCLASLALEIIVLMHTHHRMLHFLKNIDNISKIFVLIERCSLDQLHNRIRKV